MGNLNGSLSTPYPLKGSFDGDMVRGYSAYTIAVQNGFQGTEEEWLASLKGEQGDIGPRGPKGDKGTKGDKGDKGDRGDRGEKGEKGDKGDQGEKGDKGDAGYSPVRGVDYWTESDIEAIMDNFIHYPTAEEVSY